jgi:hypothetical protein
MEDDMKPKVLLATLTVMAALGGWATTEAADRDDSYRNGYYYYSDRSNTYDYYQYPDRSSAYYYYPRSNRYYRDDNRYYGYGDPHRNHLNEYSYNRYDPYGIESHDTN